MTNEFLQGVVYALGTLNRNHDEPRMCAEVLRTMEPLTVRKLRSAGCEGYDIENIKPVLREARRMASK